ncbi:MAG TPA: response regulator transcription factor [Anaerolineae bacterium]
MIDEHHPLLVDDHTLFREGLRSLLAAQPDLEVVGEAKNGLEATRLVSKLKPSVILMDIGMPVMDGVDPIPPTPGYCAQCLLVC